MNNLSLNVEIDDETMDFILENCDSLSVGTPDIDNQESVRRIRKKFTASERFNQICAVCGKKATGYNFGQWSCESCKAFFRRNAKKCKELKPCQHGGGCSIDFKKEKHCSHCRLEKCHDVGMKKELILTPEMLLKRAKTRRRKINFDDDEDEQQFMKSLSTSKMIDNRPVKTSGRDVQISMETLKRCMSPDDQKLLTKLTECISALRMPFSPAEHENTDTICTLEDVYNHMDPCVRRIVFLIKMLPGFAELPEKIQLRLLRTNIFGLIVIYRSFFFLSETQELCYPVLLKEGSMEMTTIFVSPNDFESCGHVFDDKKGTNELQGDSSDCGKWRNLKLFKDTVISVYTDIDDLSLGDSILKMLILSLVLFNYDSLPKKMHARVKLTKSKYSGFIMHYLEQKYQSNVNEIVQFSYIMNLLKDIRNLEIWMNKFIKFLSIDKLSMLMMEICRNRPSLKISIS